MQVLQLGALAATDSQESETTPEGTLLSFVISQEIAKPQDQTTLVRFQAYQDALNRFHSAWKTGHPTIPVDGDLGANPDIGEGATLASAQAATRFMQRDPRLSPPDFPSGPPVLPTRARDLAAHAGVMTPVLLQMAASAPKSGGDEEPRKPIVKRKNRIFRGTLIAAGIATLALGTGVLAGKQNERLES